MPANRISCVIPTYNGARYLAEALESVLAQSYRPIEIVVVDDGSTDDTSAVLKRFHGCVRSLRQDRKGPAAARNLGVSRANGDLIAFLDADDVWLPGKLELQAARLAKLSEVALSFSRYQNVWTPELRDEEEHFRGHPISRTSGTLSISTFVARRSVFARFGPFDEGFAQNENAIWFLRATRQGALVDVLDDVLVHRRIHPGNRSREGAIDDDFLRVLKEWRASREDPGESRV